jgi:hypothetical protein
VKLTTHLHLVPRSRIVELYLESPKRFHSMVLNLLNTGITLPSLLSYKIRYCEESGPSSQDRRYNFSHFFTYYIPMKCDRVSSVRSIKFYSYTSCKMHTIRQSAWARGM